MASTLYYLAETGDSSLDLIRSKVQELVPEFEDFEFNVVGTDRIAFGVRYNDCRKVISSSRLSAGMLSYLGLIVLVSTANRPPLLMIEEPENGLTPQAVKAFYRGVRQLAEGTGSDQRSQILLSSHSPFVICEAWNGEDRDFIHQVSVKGGRARIRKFSEVLKESGTPLSKDGTGERTQMSLKHAEELMSGYLANTEIR